MKKVGLVSCLIGFWIFVPHVLYGQGAVDAPKYQEGEKWRVRYTFTSETGYTRSDALPSGTYDIVYRDGKFLWYPAGSTSELWEGLREEDATVFYGRYTTGVPFLSFPLRVGGKTSYSYLNRHIGSRGVNLDGQVTVEKMERIRVGATEFDAYKHVMEEWGGRATRSLVYYYAPACKCIAKLSAKFGSGSAREIELLSYETR